jgi:hypothetical protein
MNAPIRTALVALVVCVMTVGVFAIRQVVSPVDSRESQRGEELRRLEQITALRIEARRQAVRELIAQRCTLSETLHRFEELDEEWPNYSAGIRKSLPVSDDDRHYEVLLAYVRAILRERPEQLRSVLNRLQEDYRKLRDGQELPLRSAKEQTTSNR